MRVLCVVFALCVLVGCSLDAPSPPEGPPVGMVRLPFADETREAWVGEGARPIVVTLWYPAAADAEMAPVSFPSDNPIFIGGDAARGAEIAVETRYPLVLLSHGVGGSALQMMWLGRALAADGYVAAAVDHHGASAAEPAFDPRGFRMPWHRARDLSVALDRLLDDPLWGPRIDGARIGAVGFSIGGYTVAALAGARTDLDRFAAFCRSPRRDATCEPQSEFPEAERRFAEMLDADPALAVDLRAAAGDFSDPRIRSFAALAPALIQAFTDESLARIARPLLSVGADADEVAPPATNAARLARLAPSARLEILAGASHYAFLNGCTAWGRWFVPVCGDGDAPRAEAQAAALDLVLDHFRSTAVGAR